MNQKTVRPNENKSNIGFFRKPIKCINYPEKSKKIQEKK